MNRIDLPDFKSQEIFSDEVFIKLENLKAKENRRLRIQEFIKEKLLNIENQKCSKR